jgi:hypothetical protein
MKPVRGVVIAAALIVVAWLVVPRLLTSGIPKRVAAAGPSSAAIYRNPEKVDIYRLHHDKGPGGEDVQVRVVTDAILEQHVSPNADWIRRFRMWADSDPSGPMPACGEDPGFAIRFTRGSDSIDYLICLHCSQYAVQKPGEQIRNWDVLGSSGRTIVPLLSEAYPQDADLRELSEAYKH